MAEFKKKQIIVAVDKHGVSLVLMMNTNLDSQNELNEAIKLACKNYLATQAGKMRYEQNGRTFDWSDVLSLPDIICRTYGFAIASVFATENCHDMHEQIYIPETS